MAIHPLTLIVFVCTLAGLDSGCGGGTNAPPPSPPPKSAVPTLLRTLYRVMFSGTDRMTSVGPTSGISFPWKGKSITCPTSLQQA